MKENKPKITIDKGFSSNDVNAGVSRSLIKQLKWDLGVVVLNF